MSNDKSKYSFWTGKKMSEETKAKISKSNTGKINSPEHRLKIKNSKLGKPRSLETRLKISASLKGKNHPNYGKHLSEKTRIKIGNKSRGRKHTQITKDKIRESHTGKKLSQEHRDKISKNNGKYWIGRTHTDLSKSKMKKSRQNQSLPIRDTKPEKMMQLALSLEGISFETHKKILGQPDIFILPNICIFIDGDFWHANPDTYKPNHVMIGTRKASDIWARDIKINHELNKMGFEVIRIWEHDIIYNINTYSKNIINLIKSVQLRMNQSGSR